MPASIAHILIADRVRARLLKDSKQEVVSLVRDVLVRHSNYMTFGALMPDLPYFGLKSLFNPSKPMGVDQWSYQMHSKNVNAFPLAMLELFWRENDPRNEGWAEADWCKFAFICGYLTHVAADQTIHPLVNLIAGPYYRSHEARDEHRTCEIHHDVCLLATDRFAGTLSVADFRSQRFSPEFAMHEQADSSPNSQCISDEEFLYFVQKAFVECHAVAPSVRLLKWRRFLMGKALQRATRQGWYKEAYSNLIDDKGTLHTSGDTYANYISLDKHRNSSLFQRLAKGKHCYLDFVDEAVGLATIYIKAAYLLHITRRVNDAIREAFLDVVANADLGFPLQLGILKESEAGLPKLEKCVDQIALETANCP